MLPLAIKLEGRPVLVIGCGAIGRRKAQQLIAQGALVTMVTREFLAEAPEGLSELHHRDVALSDFDGKLLVISATGDASLNDHLVDEARRRGVLINCVDDPERCDFYFCATVTEGEVSVAVSTNGASPDLAKALRNRIAQALPANTAHAAEELRKMRTTLHAKGISTEDIFWDDIVEQLLAD